MITNKRGFLGDIFFFIAVGVVFLVALIGFVYFVGVVKDRMGAINEQISGTGPSIGNMSNQTLEPFQEGLEQTRWLPVAFFFGMVLFIIISGFLVRVSPFFFFLYIFVVVTAVIVTVPISNYYETFLSDPVLGTTAQSFTAANFIVLNLPVWIAVVGILGLIFLLINMRREDDVQTVSVS